jgi:hypothetical protein
MASKPGPKRDDDSPKRIAELLANKPDWASHMKATCEMLAGPPDGKPAPKVPRQWREKYSVTTYVEAFEKISWDEMYAHIERRVYRGKCLDGTIQHRATRPKRVKPRTYTIRELRVLMRMVLDYSKPMDRSAWREIIREGLWTGWSALEVPAVYGKELDLIESVARETLRRAKSPAYVNAWNITEDIIDQCEQLLACLNAIPMTLRYPEHRTLLQQLLDPL